MEGYTSEEIKELYSRVRYFGDAWKRLYDFAPDRTKEELEAIVGETKAEQMAKRKEKACRMRMGGADYADIAKTLGLSDTSVKNLVPGWMKELGFKSTAEEKPRKGEEPEVTLETGTAKEENALPIEQAAAIEAESRKAEAPKAPGLATLIGQAIGFILSADLKEGEKISIEKTKAGMSLLIQIGGRGDEKPSED